MVSNPDSFYQQFEIHTPLAGRWPGWNLIAGNKENPIFRVRLGNRAHIFEVNNEDWRLAGKIVQHDKASFFIDGPIPNTTISQLSPHKFKFRIEYENQNYLMHVTDNRRVLNDSEGITIACLSNSWNDADSSKNIKFWIHHNQNIAPQLLAIFFCMAHGFDYESEDGI